MASNFLLTFDRCHKPLQLLLITTDDAACSEGSKVEHILCLVSHAKYHSICCGRLDKPFGSIWIKGRSVIAELKK